VTTLYSGQISVYSSQSRQKTLLSPNQTAIYYKDQAKLEQGPSREYLNNQWRNGLTVFEMMPLQEITKMLERNYNVVFCYQNPDKKQLRLSGSFRKQETIQEIMKVIKINTSIDYQIKGDTILLK
jgi:ferric-dicitrate binding protein FerR (iron transport regulator)